MTKQHEVTTAKLKALADGIAQAYDAVDDQSNIVDRTCRLARETFGGAEASKDQRADVAALVVAARGWEDATAKVRKSEINTILRAYRWLPDALPKAREANGGVLNWKHGIKLARKLIAAKGDVTAAVEAFVADMERTPASKAEPASAKEAKAEVAKALKKVLGTKHLPRKLRDDIVKLAEAHKLSLA